jgi:hypothetical protein
MLISICAPVYPRAMTHRFTFLVALALLGLPGCGGPTEAPGDAGVDAFAPAEDAAVAEDAAPPAPDANGPADAGMRDAASLGDAGPILPDRDAGDPFGDAGPDGPPEWVDLDVRTDGSSCDALVACGGDEVGTWDVSGGCVEVPVPADLMRCPGATLTATGMARGRVTFTGTTAVRTAQSEVIANVYIPGFCATIAGGCDAIATMLGSSFPDSACREDASGDCLCDIRQSFVIDDADGYTIEGNQIVSATLGKRWDYCVGADGTLRYRDVSSADPIEPGIIELSPH